MYYNTSIDDNLFLFLSFAVLFLAISTFITLLGFILYASYFPSLPTVVYYRTKAASEGSKTVSSNLAAAGIQVEANQEVLQQSLSSHDA